MQIVLVTIAAAVLVAVVICAIRLYPVVKQVRTAVRDAKGSAMYSALGAWTRIQEFAVAENNERYLTEANGTVAMLERDIEAWRKSAPSSTDFAALERQQETAYETTNDNIEKGENPLSHLDVP